MIYTVTFNPAIDYVMRMQTLVLGETNRSFSEEVYCGGKGINVSIVLKRLGVDCRALGFTAGFTGEEIERAVEAEGVKSDFIRLQKGISRINVKIKSDNETEINGQGPAIPQEAIAELFKKLDSLKNGDTLVLAGSIPKTLPQDIYEQILERLSGRGIRFVVDATKELLLNVLKYNPFLIKPNNYELGEMFGKELKTDDEIIFYAKKLKEMGAVNVLISMGGKGSILIDENGEVHKIGTAKGKLINSVGAGDSMVAGFIVGCINNNDYAYTLKYATACGGATAFSYGLADKETVDNLLNSL